MVGVNIGVAAPVAFFPFSGWKDSFLGDLHAHGPDAVEFYTRKKTVTSRWFSGGERALLRRDLSMNARRIWAVMSESFWILLVALVALFVFLLALGAYSPGQVLTLTIVMVGLFLLWLGHAIFLCRAGPTSATRGRSRRASGAVSRRRRTSTACIEERVRGGAAAIEPASLPGRRQASW